MSVKQPVSPVVWLIVAAVLLLPAGVVLLPKTGQQPVSMPAGAITPDAPTEHPDAPLLPDTGPPQAGRAKPTEPETEGPALPDIDGDEWRATHGYFSVEDKGLYASYTHQAIRELAASGDLLAVEVLFDRYTAADNWQAARLAAMVGAVHGSTAALGLIADFHEHLARQLREKDPDAASAARLDALAALEVALMRGDPDVYRRGVAIVRSASVALTASDLEKISGAASRLYSRLSRERDILGLPPFEDAPVARFSEQVAVDESVPWGKTFFAPDPGRAEKEENGS